MSLAYALAGPAISLLPAERAHALGLWALNHGLGGSTRAPDPCLQQQLLGLKFASPLGLAAGFDKNAEAPAAALALGFGFVEIGTVTPRPQKGNPKPRLFRLRRDQAVINRMGFNNDGITKVAERLAVGRGKGSIGLVGVNVGANKDSKDRIADYVHGIARLGPLASYLTINISSPNTPGLRALQSRAALTELLERCCDVRAKLSRRVPMLLKIAPDLTTEDIDDITDLTLASQASGGLDGLIVSNTTIDRPESLQSPHKRESGGLSGAPLFEPSTEILRQIARRLGGAMPIIGVGGVGNADQAYAKLRAGASLLQLYSALVYEGPGLVKKINEGLARRLKDDGFASVSDAIGADL